MALPGWRSSKPGIHLLEPVMAVEVVVPEDYMGDVIGDLNSRRGRITGMNPRGNMQVVTAEVPLSPDVRLLDRPAQQDAGSGHVHDAVRTATSRCRNNIAEEIVAKVTGI